MSESQAAGTTSTIDALLDQALAAANRGDLATAHRLAGDVRRSDAGNPDAGELLAAGEASAGELRRLAIMFCDLVGSTALSGRLDPEPYRRLVGLYKETCRSVVEDRYGGHVARITGDGLLAVFGHPTAHEDDVRRAVEAGLEIVAAVRRLSERSERELGESLAARVGVHRGLVYLDPEEDEIYGLAANVAARLQDLAPPSSLVVSQEVLRLLDDRFETAAQEPQKVKGVDEPLASWRVLGERPAPQPQNRRWRWATPLIGREAELARLRRAWAAARPGGVLVRGEAGIGKSRLAGALASELAGQGVRVVEISGSQLHAGVGFHPLRGLAEDGCGLALRTGDQADHTERLRRLRHHLDDLGLDPDALVPLLGPVLGIEPAAGYAPAASEARKLRDEIAAALARYLAARLGGEPALLVAEDVQWFDDGTREVLTRTLAEGHRDLLAVLTGRPGTRPLRPDFDVVDLEPLSRADSVALVAALDPAGLTCTHRDALLAHGDGVPLYLEELVRATLQVLLPDLPDLSEVPGPDGDADGDPFPGGSPATTVTPASAPPSTSPSASAGLAAGLAEAPVPDVLYQPLLARLAATPGAVQVAGAAAALGRDVDRELLARALGHDEGPGDEAEEDGKGEEGHELDATLAALVDGLVLEPVAGPPGRYRFRHELVRQVAYELRPPSSRRVVHGRVADALAATAAAGGPVDWLALATHHELAERRPEAVEGYGLAAEQARRRGDLTEARDLLGRAIRLVRELPDGPGRGDREVDLRLRRGLVAMSSEGYASPQAAEDYERCLELAVAERSGDALFTTLTTLWSYYSSKGNLARADQLVEHLRPALVGERAWLLPHNDAAFGVLDWFAGRFARARDRLEAGTAGIVAQASTVTATPPMAATATTGGAEGPVAAEPLRIPNDPGSVMLTHLALARMVGGELAGAREAFAAAARRAAQVPFPQGPYSVAHNLAFQSWIDVRLGRLAEAEATVAESFALAERHGFDFWAGAAVAGQAEIDALRACRARPVDTAALAPHAARLAGLIQMWQLGGIELMLPAVLTTLGTVLAAAGDVPAARARLDEALALAERTGLHYYDVEARRVRAGLAGLGGDPREHGRGLGDALDLAREQGAVLFRLPVACDLYRLRGPTARPLLEEALAPFPEDASFPELDAARALLDGAA